MPLLAVKTHLDRCEVFTRQKSKPVWLALDNFKGETLTRHYGRHRR